MVICHNCRNEFMTPKFLRTIAAFAVGAALMVAIRPEHPNAMWSSFFFGILCGVLAWTFSLTDKDME